MSLVKRLFTRRRRPQLYTRQEITALEEGIIQRFGNFHEVFHEIVSPDIHVDIAVIEPAPQREYFTLVTMGMGAAPMHLPKELRKQNLDRAELVVTLPAGWPVTNTHENWYWPMRWLKILARLHLQENSWLGFGHTVPAGEPVAENTQFACMLLDYPRRYGEGAYRMELPGKNVVNFYQIIPLYPEEMQEKLERGAEYILEKLQSVPYDLITVGRENVSQA